MTTALINLNDETGVDQYAVELASDVGNWLHAAQTKSQAQAFIRQQGLSYDDKTGFRDTRSRMYTRAELEEALVEALAQIKRCELHPGTLTILQAIEKAARSGVALSSDHARALQDIVDKLKDIWPSSFCVESHS